MEAGANGTAACSTPVAARMRRVRITAKEDVRDAIEQANAYPGPVLLDFHVIKEENVWPMVPAGASLAETIEDPAKNRVPVAGD